jgi:hypothetical protein
MKPLLEISGFYCDSGLQVRNRAYDAEQDWIQEYDRHMRKFGCNILTLIQQHDIIKVLP